MVTGKQLKAAILARRAAQGPRKKRTNDLDAGTQTTNHIVIELPGFSRGVAAFTNRCEQSQ
jgi:hypothetical protein